jgi:hypothetical protein
MMAVFPIASPASSITPVHITAFTVLELTLLSMFFAVAVVLLLACAGWLWEYFRRTGRFAGGQ